MALRGQRLEFVILGFPVFADLIWSGERADAGERLEEAALFVAMPTPMGLRFGVVGVKRVIEVVKNRHLACFCNTAGKGRVTWQHVDDKRCSSLTDRYLQKYP
jgi:hypothetical protein